MDSHTANQALEKEKQATQHFIEDKLDFPTQANSKGFKMGSKQMQTKDKELDANVSPSIVSFRSKLKVDEVDLKKDQGGLLSKNQRKKLAKQKKVGFSIPLPQW